MAIVPSPGLNMGNSEKYSLDSALVRALQTSGLSGQLDFAPSDRIDGLFPQLKITTTGGITFSDGSTQTTAAMGGGGVTTVGAFAGSGQTNGATISTTTITFGPADATHPGMVTNSTQTITGAKTFSSGLTVSAPSTFTSSSSANAVLLLNNPQNPGGGSVLQSQCLGLIRGTQGSGGTTNLYGFPYLGIGGLEFSAPGDLYTIGFGYSTGLDQYPAVEIGYRTESASSGEKGSFVIATRNATSNPGSERMCVNAAGNVLIGTTTDGSNGLLQINGAAATSQLNITGGTFATNLTAAFPGFVLTCQNLNFTLDPFTTSAGFNCDVTVYGNIDASAKPTGHLKVSYTDSSGTPGAVEIDNPSGRVAIAASASSVIVTNSLVTATSIVVAQMETLDATLLTYKVVPGNGSFTITGNANATGNVTFSFIVFN